MKTSDLTQELGVNFIEYAVEVNTDRAIPDAKSGLKPVAKRILWGAYNMGALSSKPHIKSATVVGEVMGKFHPHGDTSIYQAMARLAQDWVMRYPLIDWHGNKGNIIGAGPSADRYTEARLAKLSEDGMLANIKKKNVEFGLNFSDALDEPDTLPAIFPNLLCNPNTGIGVAMACNWAPHNLGEVAQAIFDYIDGKEPMLPGPDFPTGGVIINKNDIPQIMRTGRGSVKIRGKYRVEKNKLIFYEIPYGTTIQDLLENIAAACDEKLVEGVVRIYDDSNKKSGVKLVVECEKTAEPDVIAQRLFNHTNLQNSFSYNQVALVNKTPTELSLKDCIKIYLEHNTSCLIKEVAFDLKKAKDRLHIVEGLLVALSNIDDVIHIIREANDPEIELMKKYGLSEVQTFAILDMKLSRLRKLEKTKLEDEKEDLESKIKSYTDLLNSTELQLRTIKERLQNLVNKYGDARRTDLAQIAITKEEKEKVEIIPEDCVVVITQSNLIKRIPTKSFRTQKRNSTGIKNGDDIVAYMVRTNTLDNLMVFSSAGKMYRLLVDNIPEGTNVSRGVSLSTLVKFSENETGMAYSSLKHDTSAKFVFFATKNGLTKKVPLDEYRSTKKSTGIIALTLREGDKLAAVTFIENEEMLLITKGGMSIRFATKDMPISSRTAQGVKGIALRDGDEVITCLPIHKKSDNLALIAATGIGKKVSLSEFTAQNRGGRGLICYKDEIAGAALVDDDDSLLISGDKTSIKIDAKELPLLNRAAQGNAVIKNNTKVVSVVKI
ncbi:MAG: hypothetical protein NC218_11785 [Acetobacter sp.]|nr:hypothetical protein [Acetobacter sp.]